jgi:hypothetical protein
MLRTVGNSVHLKNKFGDGYHINLVTVTNKSQIGIDFVKKRLPGYLKFIFGD